MSQQALHLIDHFVNQNRDQVMASSFRNCHALGVHSIMLHDVPGQRIRVFVTAPDHVLWRNHSAFISRSEPFPLGFHGHHCDIDLVSIRGNVDNVELLKGGEMVLQEFEYSSKLLTGKAGFKYRGLSSDWRMQHRALLPGDRHHMRSEDIHSVYVQRHQVAAWFVFEGDEDPSYRPVTHSNWNLEEFDFSQLYQPCTSADLKHIVELIKS